MRSRDSSAVKDDLTEPLRFALSLEFLLTWNIRRHHVAAVVAHFLIRPRSAAVRSRGLEGRRRKHRGCAGAAHDPCQSELRGTARYLLRLGQGWRCRGGIAAPEELHVLSAIIRFGIAVHGVVKIKHFPGHAATSNAIAVVPVWCPASPLRAHIHMIILFLGSSLTHKKVHFLLLILTGRVFPDNIKQTLHGTYTE